MAGLRYPRLDGRLRPTKERRGRAFTLVELLVVITIIGILVALLLPAVQAAREAARRLQCGNNLKQLTLGVLGHELAHGHFPTGGWCHPWVGDADRGFGKRQPGGWVFNVLPFIEQNALRQLGSGTTPGSAGYQAAQQLRLQTPVAIMVCPSRRFSATFPFVCTGCPTYNATYPSRVARTDYAVNLGDTNNVVFFSGLPSGISYLQGDNDASWTSWPDTSDITGISFLRSEVRMRDVLDGASNTYCLGEKFINADYYLTGQDGGDDWSMYTGQQDDNSRSVGYRTTGNSYAYYPPMQDQPGISLWWQFGSAHPSGLHMSLCDGSVRWINYTISPEVHRRLGNRKDGLTIDSKSF
jgi:prepilin-type N-terminal cleavage/methylation domain-containing protein